MKYAKKTLATLLAVIMVFSLFPVETLAMAVQALTADAVWDGTVASEFAAGRGTADDPYIIETPQQLAYFSQEINNGNAFEDQYIRLAKDIRLNDEIFIFRPDSGLVEVTDGENTAYFGTGWCGDDSGSSTAFDTTPSVRGEWYSSENGTDTTTYAGELHTWIQNGGYFPITITSSTEFYAAYRKYKLYYKSGSSYYSATWYRDGYEYAYLALFQGTFDGAGYNIQGLYRNDADRFAGLFGYVEGTVQNVTIDDSLLCDTYGAGYVGGAVGELAQSGTVEAVRSVGVVLGVYAGGVVGHTYGTVTDSTFGGTALSPQSGSCAGGIVGYMGNIAATVSGCVNRGQIYAYEYAGGIVGNLGGMSGSSDVSVVKNCLNHGRVYAADSTVGGIVGYGQCNVSVCTNYGAVKSGRIRAGGIVGSLPQNYTVEDCYSLGSVDGSWYVGGIVGGANGAVYRCYNAGPVQGTGSGAYVGAIVGTVGTTAQLQNNYYRHASAGMRDGTAHNGVGVASGESAAPDLAGAYEGRYGDELHEEATFVGWDFNKVWEFGFENWHGYPTLREIGSKTYRCYLSFYNGDTVCEDTWCTSGGTFVPQVPTSAEYDFAYWLAEDGTRYAAGEAIPVTWDAEYRAVWRERNVSAHVWDGSFDMNWRGSGTAEDPYLIETPEHLAGLVLEVNDSYKGVYFRQTKDLWMNEAATSYSLYMAAENEWTPIEYFCGNYDGDNHTIHGLYTDRTDDVPNDYVGLFGTVINGTVENLSLADSFVHGKRYVGGIAGSLVRGRVRNCYVSGCVMGRYTVGGVAGIARQDGSEALIDCTNAATIVVKDGSQAGGVLGCSTSAAVTDCNNYGTILTTNTDSVGGVIASADSGVFVYRCYNGGAIYGDGKCIGGIVGWYSYPSKNYIFDCYNTGAVNGGDTGQYVGGILGGGSDAMERCYNVGTVYGQSWVGAISGVYLNRSADCYYLTGCAVNSQGTVQFGAGAYNNGTEADVAGRSTGLTAEQMRDSASFANFDFDTVWGMGLIGDKVLPVLQNGTETVTVRFLSYTGEELFPAAIWRVRAGETYRVEVPAHATLTPDQTEVSGVAVTGGANLTVTYYDRRLTAYGDCGETIRWELSDEGVLRLIGYGAMPEGVAPWADYAADICEVDMDDRITAVSDYVFAGCEDLTYIDFSKSLKTIGGHAFEGCVNLTDIVLPETVTAIGEYAFFGSGLRRVEIAAGVKTIGAAAFQNDGTLTEATFMGKVDRIGANAFASDALNNVVFKNLPPDEVGAVAFGSTDAVTVYYYSTVSGWRDMIQDGRWNGYWAMPFDAVTESTFDSSNVFAVRVSDKHGTALQGAVVQLGDTVQVADWEGIAYFALPPATATLTVSCSDHITFTDAEYQPRGARQVEYIVLEDSPSTVQGVRVNGKSIATAVYTLNTRTEKTASITVSGYSKYTILRYELLQGNRILATQKTAASSCTFRVATADMEEEALVVRMWMSDGSTVSAALNIDVVQIADFSNVEILNGGETLNVNLPVVGNLPISLTTKAGNYTEVEYEGRTVKIGINLDLTDIKSGNVDEAVDSIVNTFKTAASVKPKLECALTGYIELQYLGNGEYAISKSNVKFCVGGKIVGQGNAGLWGVVGVRFKITFGGVGGVSLDFAGYDVEDGFIFEDVSLLMANELGLEGSAYVLWGLGSGGLYGNAKAELMLEVHPDFGIESFKISGEVGATWSIFWGLHSGKRAFWKGDIYSYQRAAARAYMLRSLRAAVMNDPENYTLHDRTYLQNRSPWQVQDGAVTDGYYDLQRGAYENIAPEVVTCGDTTVMVWLDDNPTRDDDNFQTLYYAVLNRETGAWSEPVSVDSNDTFDCEFDLATDGEQIYLVYTEQAARMENVDEIDIGDSDQLGMLTDGVEVAFTVFNGTGFAEPTRITANERGEALPALYTENGTITASWVALGTAVDLMERRGNTVMFAQYENGVWTAPAAVIGAQNQIDDIAHGTLGGAAYTAYTVDSDGDSETVEDIALLLVDAAGTARVAAEGAITHLQFAAVDGAAVLLYQLDGQIYMYDGENATALLPDGVYSYTDFATVTMPDGQTLLTFTATGGEETKNTDVYGLYVNLDGALGAPVRLTETEGYVDAYGIAVLENELAIAFAETHVEFTDEAMITSTDFRYTVVNVAADAAIGGAEYAFSDVQPEKTVPLKITLDNRGLVPVRKAELALYDPRGTLVAATTKEITLAAGESTVVTWDVALPQTILDGEYALYLTLPAQTDGDVSNNACALTLAYTDFSVAALPVVMGTQRYVSVTVENVGNTVGTATLTLYTADGVCLAEKVCRALAPHQTAEYLVPVESQISAAAQTVFCRVSAEADSYPTNDTTSVYLLPSFQAIPVVPSYVPNPTYTVSHTVYDKAAGGDITVTITDGAEKFQGLCGLAENTDYGVSDHVITVYEAYLDRLAEGNHTLTLEFDYDSDTVVTRAITLTVEDSAPTAITGDVMIAGSVTVGSTVTADVTGVYPSDAAFAFCWQVNGVTVGNDASYTLTAADLGGTLTLTVTGKEEYSGTLTCQAQVGYREQAAPSAPIVQTIGTTTVTLVAVDGLQYSMDGVYWQNSAVFTDLEPNTAYTFRARRAATATAAVSAPGAAVTVVTKPIAVTGVALDHHALTLDTVQNTTATLTATVVPATATDRTVHWHSSDDTVVTVQDGVITAVGHGVATVTVTTADGGYTDTCVVTVRCLHRVKTFTAAKKATCCDGGWQAYYVCDICAQVLAEDGSTPLLEIPYTGTDAANHSGERQVEAEEATCVKQGHEAYRYCADCQTVTAGSAAWFYGEHAYGTLVEATPARHTAEELVAAVAAHYLCTVCDTYFTAEKEETTLQALTGEMPSHEYEAMWSQDGTYHYRRCTACEAVTDRGTHSGGVATCCEPKHCDVCSLPYGDLAACVFTQRAQEPYRIAEATCTLYAVYVESCELCGAVGTETFESGTLNTENHVGEVYVTDQTDANCSQEGYSGDVRCADCHEILHAGTSIATRPHAWDDGEITKEATPTQRGELTHRCVECGSTTVTYFDFAGLLGDVDNDGDVDSTDARLTLQYAVQKVPTLPNLAAADVDASGRVDSTDARLILQYAVRKIADFPANV